MGSKSPLELSSAPASKTIGEEIKQETHEYGTIVAEAEAQCFIARSSEENVPQVTNGACVKDVCVEEAELDKSTATMDNEDSRAMSDDSVTCEDTDDQKE